MKKMISLLKASLTQDMNLFKISIKKNSSPLKKALFPLFLALLFMYAIGTYAYLVAESLHKLNLTFIMLTLFIIIVSIFSFIEGIYKSQGILFDAKDNDLLFSLPIEKRTIFFLRIIKLLIFQFLYNLLFLIPVFGIYIYFENPSITFYLISFIFLFLIPIIPTVLSSIIGYFIKLLSNKFKSKKIVQTLLTIITLLGIFFISFNTENLIKDLVKNATSINDLLTKIYYPVGSYISLIEKFDLVVLIKLILLNIIPLIFLVYLGALNYFKIISKTKETASSKKNTSTLKIKPQKVIISLIKKEASRFFSSPIYILNTTFGIFIMFALTIGLYIKGINLINSLSSITISTKNISAYLPIIYCELIVFVSFLTSITSSTISIEGKSFNITKTLPISTNKIFMSKILFSNIISIPLMLISDILFIFKFNPNTYYSILIILLTITLPTLSALIGLLVNLKYPKMNASNDTEIVKQSMSVTICAFIGIAIFSLSVFAIVKLFKYSELILTIELIISILGIFILWYILTKYGNKQFMKINV